MPVFHDITYWDESDNSCALPIITPTIAIREIARKWCEDKEYYNIVYLHVARWKQ